MGLFGHKSTPVPPPVSNLVPTAPVVPTPVQAPASGKINLSKGASVNLTKGATAIEVSNGWAAPKKDYDLKALVRYHNGQQIYVGAANRDEALVTPEGAVRHGGDVKEGSTELETVTISWHPEIASVALSSYSALDNGTGSFREYGVFVEIKNGSQVISLSAADASANGRQYTLCFGEVLFNEDGSMTVVNLEKYSRPGSECRVGYQGDRLMMDIGPKGKSK